MDGAGADVVSVSLRATETALPKKTTLVFQITMTFMMALAMSGTLGFLNFGLEFWSRWLQTFIIVWPIAFICTRIINPIAFKIAFKIAPPHQG